MRAGIAHAATTAKLVAATLVALSGIRFAGYAIVRGIEARVPGPEASQIVTGEATATAAVEAPPMAPGVVPPREQTPPAATDAAGDGQAVRSTLLVTAGPARSEVLVDGAPVGHTPFLGEVSCKLGASISIQVLPARGAPLGFRASCIRGTIRVD
jgi:hypothetical protein